MGRHYDDQRDRVLTEDEGACRACGSQVGIKVHHIVPRASGGEDVVGNLITLCRACEMVIHVDHLWPGFLRRNRRNLPPEAVYNVTLLREMRLLGRGSSERESARKNFQRRCVKPQPQRLNPYDLSPPVLNVAYFLEGNEIDGNQGPMVLICGEFEVTVRVKESGCGGE